MAVNGFKIPAYPVDYLVTADDYVLNTSQNNSFYNSGIDTAYVTDLEQLTPHTLGAPVGVIFSGFYLYQASGLRLGINPGLARAPNISTVPTAGADTPLGSEGSPIYLYSADYAGVDVPANLSTPTPVWVGIDLAYDPTTHTYTVALGEGNTQVYVNNSLPPSVIQASFPYTYIILGYVTSDATSITNIYQSYYQPEQSTNPSTAFNYAHSCANISYDGPKGLYRTGMFLGFMATNASRLPPGWIFMPSVLSLGAQGSVAKQLYVQIWEDFDNTACPVSGGRGASGLADFLAGKSMTIVQGNVAFGFYYVGGPINPGYSAGSSTGSFSSTYTSNSKTLTVDELPAHNHPFSYDKAINVAPQSGSSTDCFIPPNVTTSSTTGNTGGGQAFTISTPVSATIATVSPIQYYPYILKL